MTTIKKFRILGVALSAMFAFGTIAVASATAAPEWLLNGAAIGKEEKDAGETKAAEELLFEFKGLVTIDVDCKVSMKGTAGPGATGTITEATFTECKLLEGMGPLEETAPLKLPWLTEVTLVMEGVNLYRDLVLSNGAGEPGWLIKVNGVDIVCEWEATKESFAEITNEVGGVDWTYHGNEAPAAKCSSGGEGRVNGLLFFSVAGSTLSVSG